MKNHHSPKPHIFKDACYENTTFTPAEPPERQQLLQRHAAKRRVTKSGGGGARAAWRIRIRRPPVLRGGNGVSDHSGHFEAMLTQLLQNAMQDAMTKVMPDVLQCMTKVIQRVMHD